MHAFVAVIRQKSSSHVDAIAVQKHAVRKHTAMFLPLLLARPSTAA